MNTGFTKAKDLHLANFQSLYLLPSLYKLTHTRALYFERWPFYTYMIMAFFLTLRLFFIPQAAAILRVYDNGTFVTLRIFMAHIISIHFLNLERSIDPYLVHTISL